ncbi:oxidoreductase [Leptodontidium sp. 2 PMI_412]|nr:oxidoreductase [Leptodontidium sp. 2 PMI_412]
MSQIKVGFVGYGGSAKTYHLPYLLPVKEFQIYAFLQRAAAPPTECAAPGSHCTVDFPEAKHYRTAEDFFRDPAIEVVIVTTHTDTHASFAEKAIEAGKHVVVEKPFTRTSEEADKLLAMAKEKGVILTVYQNRRWDGDFRTLRHLVSKKAFGTITEAQIYYDFENPPWIKYLSAKKYTPGDGLLFGLGSHTLDQALVLFGRPKSVTAFLKVLRGIESEVDDTFTVILQYESPLLVTVKTAIVSCLPQPIKYIVRGTDGSYVKYGDDIQERQTLSGMKSTDPAFGINPEDEYGTLTTYAEFDSKNQKFDPLSNKYNGKFPTLNGFNQGYYESLADSVRRKAPLQVDPQTSRDGIRLMELARESHDTGRTVSWS